MKSKILGMVLILGLLWVVGCDSVSQSGANVRLLNIKGDESRLGSPCFKGELQNVGDSIACGVTAYVFMYEDESKSDLLEKILASVSSISLKPGQVTQFEAVPSIFMLREVASVDVKIDWK